VVSVSKTCLKSMKARSKMRRKYGLPYVPAVTTEGFFVALWHIFLLAEAGVGRKATEKSNPKFFQRLRGSQRLPGAFAMPNKVDSYAAVVDSKSCINGVSQHSEHKLSCLRVSSSTLAIRTAEQDGSPPAIEALCLPSP
jgi:hypothetical protein